MDLKKFLSWIPGWLGFLLLILVGIAMTLNGALNPNLDHVNQLGFLVFGICAAAVGIFSWIAGATSEIKGKVGKVGIKVAVSDMPWWAWLVDILLIVIAIVIFMVGKG